MVIEIAFGTSFPTRRLPSTIAAPPTGGVACLILGVAAPRTCSSSTVSPILLICPQSLFLVVPLRAAAAISRNCLDILTGSAAKCTSLRRRGNGRHKSLYGESIGPKGLTSKVPFHLISVWIDLGCLRGVCVLRVLLLALAFAYSVAA